MADTAAVFVEPHRRRVMRERQKFRQAGKGAGKVADPVFQYNFDDLVRQRRQPLSEEPFMSGIWPKPPVRLWRELAVSCPSALD